MSKVWVELATLQNVLSVSRSVGLPVGQSALPKSPALKDSGISVTCAEPAAAPADTAPLVSSSGTKSLVKKTITGNPQAYFQL